ncbi:MAG: FtsX-like permease family protein, partial [Oscillospiraceae bacterium]|nr:FtsX-like permease family protein [Oscillospiraceae bacterium]
KAEIEQAKQDLAEAKIELSDGWAEYEEGKKELDDAKIKLDDGKKELDDARSKIDSIKKATTYTLTRNANHGYVSFGNDTDIVHDIAVVFPLFFFLVAALICMTTMTRMVDEQRTQIGIYKALGYSKAAIMAKYLLYSASASFIGCVVGAALGSYLFPQFIWSAYNIMYGFSELLYAFDWPLVIVSSAAFIACCTLATWYSCSRELGEKPASLIRPKTAKAGKRILLERIGFLWKRLPFLSKVTARNIFRYRQRMIIMIIGIGGCTALLLTGFGIKDSIKDVGNYQYGEISTYDAQLGFDDGLSVLESHELLRRYEDSIEGACFLNQASMDVSANSITKTSAVCTANEESLKGFFNFLTEGDEMVYPAPGEAAISHGLALSLDAAIGDTVTLSDGEVKTELKVSGIFTNYVQNYVFICPRTYYDMYGETAEINEAFVNFTEGTDTTDIASRLSEDELVSTVIIVSERLSYLNDMLDSLKYITVVIIICAAALAFIVIYNLTNINITERIREIATVKVLGFFTGETSVYVFSENLILTLIGSFVGLPLGIFLHRFVMSNITIDSIRFDVRIIPISFMLSIVLTMVFAIVIYALMQIKLKRIDMAQALKSNE